MWGGGPAGGWDQWQDLVNTATNAAGPCEYRDQWQAGPWEYRDQWQAGPCVYREQWQDLASTGTSAAGPCEYRDQWKDLVNTGTSGRTLWTKGPVTGPCEQRDQWQDLANTGTSGRSLWAKGPVEGPWRAKRVTQIYNNLYHTGDLSSVERITDLYSNSFVIIRWLIT